jgi:hypothetical protein
MDERRVLVWSERRVIAWSEKRVIAWRKESYSMDSYRMDERKVLT